MKHEIFGNLRTFALCMSMAKRLGKRSKGMQGHEEPRRGWQQGGEPGGREQKARDLAQGCLSISLILQDFIWCVCLRVGFSQARVYELLA